MKILPAITILSVLFSLGSSAQNVPEEPQADPVLEAIQKFQNRDRSKMNEVSVVLDDPAPTTAQEPEAPTEELKDPTTPVLVIGKHSNKLNRPSNESDDLAVLPVIEPINDALKSDDGLAVRVEKIKSGTGGIDPEKVKLTAPFPAKPLGQPPAGWHLEFSKSSPPFTREVEISAGKKISLTIYPHLLVPDADGVSAFCIAEPGFDSSRGYQQTQTVGAVLATSIRQLEDESKQLGGAIDGLQQLLVSLPRPEVVTEVKPVTIRKK